MLTLCTLNARYSHASLGLRYLLANLGEFIPHTRLLEFTTKTPLPEMLDAILQAPTKVIGLGVYIWNVPETRALLEALKARAPDITVILGGPEISHETQSHPLYPLADYVVTGWGEVTLPALLQSILKGPKPLMKIHPGIQPPLSQIQSPYHLYTAEDIARRNLYVEASRGCPFKCEFCLSSLDKTAWAFELEPFLADMQSLYEKGARKFKFVDRTFNLKPETGRRILDFFLERNTPEDPIFAHFEVVPDHLPELLKTAIAQFPPGTLQFEVGIQTLNPSVQKNISRKTNLKKAKENVAWLRTQSHAHLHVDLIGGLPGESLESFKQGFNELITWGAHEIQLGILKRLRGTPVIRHTEAFQLVFSPDVPYEIIQTADMSEAELTHLKYFAKYWDLIANSCRFQQSLPLILGNEAQATFARFSALTTFLSQTLARRHSIARNTLFEAVASWLETQPNMPPREHIQTLLTQDYLQSGARERLAWMPPDFRLPPPQPKKAALMRQNLHAQKTTLS